MSAAILASGDLMEGTLAEMERYSDGAELEREYQEAMGGADNLFGVFGTTWYHKLPLPGVAEFVKKGTAEGLDLSCAARIPASPIFLDLQGGAP